MVIPVIIRRLLLLFLIDDLLQPSRKIHLQGISRPCILLMRNTVSEVDCEEDRDADVCCEEAAGAPSAWEKDVEAVD